MNLVAPALASDYLLGPGMDRRSVAPVFVMPAPQRVATRSVVASLSLLCLSSAVARVTAQGMPPPAVRAAASQVSEVADLRGVPGNLRARSRARVAAAVSAKIVEVPVRESDVVEKGAPLARLDDRRLHRQRTGAVAQLAEAEAQVALRRAEHEAAVADLRSYEKAEADMHGSVSGIVMRGAIRDEAVSLARLRAAERSVDRLQAAVASLDVQLTDTVVRAPFDGVVVERLVEPGEWANAGTVVAVLVATGTIEAWVEVPEQIPAADLHRVAALDVKVDSSGRVLRSTGVRIVPDVDPRSRRYVLIAELDPGDLPLAPGMSVTAMIPNGEKTERVLVPGDAVMRDGGGYFVYRVVPGAQGGDIVVPVVVVPRFPVDGLIALDGRPFADGTAVIVEGNERLRPGQAVQVIGREGAK